MRRFTYLALAALAVAGCNTEEFRAAVTRPAAPPPVRAAPSWNFRQALPPAPTARTWVPLSRDGMHDTSNPAVELLQQPSEALSALPPAYQGNQVDWAAALRQGDINPRTNIFPETKVQILDLNILFPDTGGVPMVLFPHRPHTEWLDCKNCHDSIFIPKRGANKFSMIDVLQGRYCGRCHGAVSFPLTQCARCHSVPRDDHEPTAQQGAR